MPNQNALKKDSYVNANSRLFTNHFEKVLVDIVNLSLMSEEKVIQGC